MTPAEAMKTEFAASVLTVWQPTLRLLFESVASTAHDDEARRCSDMAIAYDCRELAYELRRTGGLEVDE